MFADQFFNEVFLLIMKGCLYPVMLLLLIFLAVALYMLGHFFAEYVFRKNNKADAQEVISGIIGDMPGGMFEDAGKRIEQHLVICSSESRELRGFLKDLAIEVKRGPKDLDVRVENILQEHETHTATLLDKGKALVRLGPTLGLMGTLIPIGGALLSLSVGDLTQMSNNLIIAFGTTVVGLAIASIAYVVCMKRERWYERDMKAMEFIAEIFMRSIGVSKNGAA